MLVVVVVFGVSVAEFDSLFIVVVVVSLVAVVVGEVGKGGFKAETTKLSKSTPNNFPNLCT